MFIAFTGPLALLLLDVLFLGLFGLISQIVSQAASPVPGRLWQHAKITFGSQLALGLLLLALASGFDLNSLNWTKFFALLIFSSAFVVPLGLQIRHFRRTHP